MMWINPNGKYTLSEEEIKERKKKWQKLSEEDQRILNNFWTNFFPREEERINPKKNK